MDLKECWLRETVADLFDNSRGRQCWLDVRLGQTNSIKNRNNIIGFEFFSAQITVIERSVVTSLFETAH